MSFDPAQHVTDPRGLRAVAHPIRLSLLELLAYEGPLTATEAGQRLGESPASCSFHLRQLARYGFIEEAGGGTGRQRPWRAVRGAAFTPSESDPAAAQAGAALTELVEERWRQLVQRWNATSHSYSVEWQDSAVATYRPMFMTAQELKAVGEAIDALFEPYRGRMNGTATRPADGLPIAFVAYGFPVAPPAVDDPRKASKKRAAVRQPRRPKSS
ncbi:MAG: winged helix-turn-helix domain-containing protein [Acidothermaceae bacterium]